MVETSLAEPAIIHNLGDVDLRVGAALENVGLEDNIRYRFRISFLEARSNELHWLVP